MDASKRKLKYRHSRDRKPLAQRAEHCVPGAGGDFMFARRTLAVLSLATFALCSAATAQKYVRTDLVSNQPGVAPTTDTNLVNAWGIARSATSPWWVSDNGTGVSTLYNGSGQKLALTVTLPSA